MRSDRLPDHNRPAGRRRRGTMAEEAERELRELIVFGELAPGAPLRLEELAESLDMSISPVREAIRQLENLGLAEHVAYRGARVTLIDAEEMHEVYEARVALEVVAVRRAARSLGSEWEGYLRDVLTALDTSYGTGDYREIVRGNSRFHAGLAGASGSRWIERLIRPALDTSERYSASILGSQRDAETHAIEQRGHREILEACVAGDPDAAEQALRDHLAVFEELFGTRLLAGAGAPDPPTQPAGDVLHA